MNLAEFDKRFDALWREKYALYDLENDNWTVERDDAQAKRLCRDLLLGYARDVQGVGVSRRGRNKPQRLFDEMGLDPADLQLDEAGMHPDDGDTGDHAAETRIMYIERKAGSLTGEARIGRVSFSRTKRTIYYGGRSFRSLDGKGRKSNYLCVETGEDYWISGCKKDGSDRLYGERVPVHIDEDVREEYWTDIRKNPENRHLATTWKRYADMAVVYEERAQHP